VRIAYFCSVNMYTKLVQVLHFKMLLTSCIETNELSLSHAVVRLCNWQRSNVLADCAKNPDKPPIFENPSGRPGKGQKEDVSGETRTYGNPISDKSVWHHSPVL